MIGNLRHRITIEQRTLASDGMGGSTETWSTLATLWAKVEPKSAKHKWIAESLTEITTHVITIRNRDDIDSSMRIKWDGRTFQIEGSYDRDERDRFRIIAASEGLPA